jgi:hypothetical protein
MGWLCCATFGVLGGVACTDDDGVGDNAMPKVSVSEDDNPRINAEAGPGAQVGALAAQAAAEGAGSRDAGGASPQATEDARPSDGSLPEHPKEQMRDTSETGRDGGGVEPVLGAEYDPGMCNRDASYDYNLAVRVTDETGNPICGAKVRATNQSGWDQELTDDLGDEPGVYYAGEFYGFVDIRVTKAGYARTGRSITLDQCIREEGRVHITLHPGVDGGTPNPGCGLVEAGAE